MADYRAVPEADRIALRRARYYAFAPEEGPTAHESDEPELTGTHRGLYDGEELVCACSYYDFPSHVRGSWLDVGGIGGVATPPEHRRQGLVRRLLGDLLAEFRSAGTPVSTLWPFDYDFYARLGWATACTRTRYEFEPAALSFAATDQAGEFRRLAPDDAADLLDPVYERFLAGRSLATRRDAEWWRRRVCKRHDEERYVYAWIDDGDVRGYLVYEIDGDWETGRTLSVSEFAYTDSEARRQLFRFLYNHDSQVESVELALPAETWLLDEVTDPEAVECAVEPGPMVRLVSVPDAIEALSYPEEIDGTVTVAVADSLADWNDDTFEISFADGQATCEPVPDGEPDLRVGVDVLSQLYVGYQSLETLRELDAIDVESSDRATLLAAAFPERPVWLPERF